MSAQQDVFGFEPVTQFSLTNKLLATSELLDALELASRWWNECEKRAVEETIKKDLVHATIEAINGHSVDDLFADGSVAKGEALARACGFFKTSQGNHYKFDSKLVSLPKSLLKELVSSPDITNSFIVELLAELEGYRLNFVTVSGTQVTMPMMDGKDKLSGVLFGSAFHREAYLSAEFRDTAPFHQSSSSPLSLLFTPSPIPGSGGGDDLFDRLAPNSSDVGLQMTLVRGNLHTLQQGAASVLQKALKSDREGVQAWLANAVGCHLDSLQARAAPTPQAARESGYAANLIATVLLLFRPLLQREPRDIFGKISLDFLDEDWRIPFGAEAALLDSSDGSSSREERTVAPCKRERDDGDGDEELQRAIAMSLEPHADPGFFPEGRECPFNFITEIFWATARCMNLHFLLNVRYGEHLRLFQDQAERSRRQREERGAPARDPSDPAERALMAHIHGWETHLFDPQQLTLAGQWASFAAAWLLSFLPSTTNTTTTEKAQTVFRRIPAFLVKAICDVWTVVASLREAQEILTPIQATDAALFCVEFMQRPDLISSPVVQAKFVDVITAFQSTAGRSSSAAAAASSPTKYFGSGRGFASAVMDVEEIRRRMAPALMKLYSEVHAIVGLDVDKDKGFDKFSVRHRVNALLVDLFLHPLQEPRQSILLYAETSPDFPHFLTAAYDTITYNFHDALERMADGCRLEEQFGGKPPPSTDRQSRYYGDQRRASRSFIRASNSTFAMLSTLCTEPALCRRLCLPDVVDRTAGTLVACLNAQCDPDRRARIAVAEPGGWGYDPASNLSQCATLLARCFREGGAPVLAAVSSLGDFDLTALVTASESRGGEALAPLAASLQSAAAAVVEEASGPAAAPVDWSVYEETTRERMERNEAYESATEDMVLSQVTGFEAHGHYFQSRRDSSQAGSVRGVMREMKRMKRMLPDPHPDGSIFVFMHEDDPCLTRAVITGPVGTPYFGGLFVFDVYFPPSYPNEAPLVQLITTGQGTVRFNPNLYADGKVCLSVLGTWHGQESEKWQPGVSSLYQVLMSIVAEILVPEPYYNEPGREGQRTTQQGREASHLCNSELRLATVRHAMIAHLRSPRSELTGLIHAHFRSIGNRILLSLKHELEGELSSSHRAKFMKAFSELDSLLRSLV